MKRKSNGKHTKQLSISKFANNIIYYKILFSRRNKAEKLHRNK